VIRAEWDLPETEEGKGGRVGEGGQGGEMTQKIVKNKIKCFPFNTQQIVFLHIVIFSFYMLFWYRPLCQCIIGLMF
jgi:hypothetical protein